MGKGKEKKTNGFCVSAQPGYKSILILLVSYSLLSRYIWISFGLKKEDPGCRLVQLCEDCLKTG